MRVVGRARDRTMRGQLVPSDMYSFSNYKIAENLTEGLDD